MDKIYDAIVVGSGASGSYAAKELTEGGLEVLVLEAGDLIQSSDFPVPCTESPVATTKDRLKAAVTGQHIQARCTSFSPKTRHLFVNDRENPYTTSKNSPFLWYRSRKLGGRTHLWGRLVMRWSDVYFKAADHDGCGENWAISYADVEPFYKEVETFLGVYGTRDQIPHLPDSCYAGPRDLTPSEKEFANVFKDSWPDRFLIPARTVRHNPQRVPLAILSAQKTGRLTIQANAVVRRISIDSRSGKANGIHYIDAKAKKEMLARANVIVLCASPVESVRILFNSGIGNSSGMLGHYFMDHCALLFFGPTHSDSVQVDSNEDPWDLARDSGFYIPRFRNISERRSDFARGYAIHGGIDRTPNFWWMFTFGQVIPSFENRVLIDPHKRDAWGIPVARIEFSRSSNDLALAADAKATVLEIIRKSGLTMLEETPEFQNFIRKKPLQSYVYQKLQNMVFCEPNIMIPGSGIHELGGARSGENPRTSVLNTFQQSWDVKNLFVMDASIFPSSGEHHTLTTMALAIRASRYLVEQYRRDLL